MNKLKVNLTIISDKTISHEFHFAGLLVEVEQVSILTCIFTSNRNSKYRLASEFSTV